MNLSLSFIPFRIILYMLPLVSMGVFLYAYFFESAQATSQCDTPANPIVAENCKPGNPSSEWEINGDLGKAGSSNIQGFVTEFSVNIGETVRFKVKTNATSYRLDIYRLGYYDGMGARKITTASPSASLPQIQPDCLADSTVGLIDCGNWTESASWALPANAVSGVYFAKLVREDSEAGSSHIYFIVRNDEDGSDVLFQTSDTTWQAYNQYGGASLYRDGVFGQARAKKVSYNRPFNTRSNQNGLGVRSFLFNAEYPMIRWLERNGYSVSYFSGVDTAQRGQEILEHKVFLSVGHDEYWASEQRANVEAARDAGVNLAFLSGNEIFWKTRWENSIDSSGTSYKTLVTYKETHANQKIDPLENVWTGTWRDPRFSPPADGGRPENAVTGTIFTVNGPIYQDLKVPEKLGKLRFWRNTSVANLLAGEEALIPKVLGHEWDEDLDNGFRPAGIMRMSQSTHNVAKRIMDHGSTYKLGVATHSLTLYRHPISNALVFGAGTVQWSWSLDNNHDRDSFAPIVSPDVRIQQATVNILADMNIQPASLQQSLIVASVSTDTIPPVTTITSPPNNNTYPIGAEITVTGTASDTNGKVAGVEISLDNGIRWHPASGLESWKYTFITEPGTIVIKSRAVDDSGNLENPSAGVTVTASEDASCPCDLFGSEVPAKPLHYAGSVTEVGMKFKPSAKGFITGIRFYKGTGNSGTHIANLWSSNGQNLARETFTDETANGWQKVNLSNHIPVNANETYIVSYHSPTGLIAWNGSYFINQVAKGPLTGLASGSSGGNGVYVHGQGGIFPTQTYYASNYWVDVVFDIESNQISKTIFGNATPSVSLHDVGRSAEVGVKFRSAVNGYIKGVKFYKGLGNTGPHTGTLWTNSGVMLASVVFTNETDSGWQQMNFPSAIAINANTTYIISYHTNRYVSWDNMYFAGSVTNNPLTALSSSESEGNGVYKFGSSVEFPTQTFNASNYWVDVLFSTEQ